MYQNDKNIFGKKYFEPQRGPPCHEPGYKMFNDTDTNQKTTKKVKHRSKEPISYFSVPPRSPQEAVRGTVHHPPVSPALPVAM